MLLHCHQLRAPQQRALSQHQGSFPRPAQQEREQNSGNGFFFFLSFPCLPLLPPPPLRGRGALGSGQALPCPCCAADGQTDSQTASTGRGGSAERIPPVTPALSPKLVRVLVPALLGRGMLEHSPRSDARSGLLAAKFFFGSETRGVTGLGGFRHFGRDAPQGLPRLFGLFPNSSSVPRRLYICWIAVVLLSCWNSPRAVAEL